MLNMTRLEIEAGLRTLGWFKYRSLWTKKGPLRTQEQRRLFQRISLREAAAWEGLTACESLS